MKLHRDKYSFLNIIGLIHGVTGIREDILEKDYYVTLLLKELSEKQETLPAYFKGGTALYKAQKSIRRFSEDIDLTICIDNCSGSQAKKRLETATKKYLSLPRTSRKELEDDRKGSITAVYDYTPLVDRKFPDFKIFYDITDNTALKDAYQNMQKNYVFSEKDLLTFEFVISQWKKLQEVLNDMENGK